MKELKDLPNIKAFEFVGITKDNKKVDCFIHQDVTGSYVVLAEITFKRMYELLKCWHDKRDA